MVRVLWIVLISLFSIMPLTSCSEDAANETEASQNADDVDDGYIRKPLKIVTQDGRELFFDVEVADTPQSTAQGLMHRKQMAADHGMIFIFPSLQPLSFWMKNTYLPLDILFLDTQGTILNIEEGIPLNEESVYARGLAKAALELNRGTAEKMGIQAGDKVIFSGLK